MKKNSKEREKENLIDKKRNADQKWEELFNRITNGEKIDQKQIAQVMGECNWADYALMQRGFREYISTDRLK